MLRNDLTMSKTDKINFFEKLWSAGVFISSLSLAVGYFFSTLGLPKWTLFLAPVIMTAIGVYGSTIVGRCKAYLKEYLEKLKFSKNSYKYLSFSDSKALESLNEPHLDELLQQIVTIKNSRNKGTSNPSTEVFDLT